MSRKDYTIDDWRSMAMAHYEAYEFEQRDHQATKLRHDMQWEKATCLERILLRLLFDVDKSLSPNITDESRWKRAHHRFDEMLDDELQILWQEQEDSE